MISGFIDLLFVLSAIVAGIFEERDYPLNKQMIASLVVAGIEFAIIGLPLLMSLGLGAAFEIVFMGASFSGAGLLGLLVVVPTVSLIVYWATVGFVKLIEKVSGLE